MAQDKAISSLMTETRTFPPPARIKKTAYVSSVAQYKKMWEQSINDPDEFWLEQAEIPDLVQEADEEPASTRGTPRPARSSTPGSPTASSTSRSTASTGTSGTPTAKKTALIWQGEPEDDVRKITYEQLHKEVCKFANVLKSQGVKKGDRVSHLPADDSRAADRHARLRPHRRDPLDRLRRLQRRGARRTASTTPTASC